MPIGLWTSYQNLLFEIQHYFSLTDSVTLTLGFHTFTPTKPPIPETTAITAKVRRYERTILKNSIKFAIYYPLQSFL